MLKHASPLHSRKLFSFLHGLPWSFLVFLTALSLTILSGSAFNFQGHRAKSRDVSQGFHPLRKTSVQFKHYLLSNTRILKSKASAFVVEQEESVHSNEAEAPTHPGCNGAQNDTSANMMDLKPLEELQSFTSSISKALANSDSNETGFRPFFATMVPAKSTLSDETSNHDHSTPPPIVFDSHLSDDSEPLKRHRSWRRFFTADRDDFDDEEDGSAPNKSRENSARKLSSLLARTASNSTAGRQYAARTITGLINALAEEVSDLDVEVNVDEDTPLHEKHFQSVKIEFSRLGFKPLWLGGHHSVTRLQEKQNVTTEAQIDAQVLGSILSDAGTNETIAVTADEAFDRMDADKSGFIDYDELLQTLSLIASRSAGMNNTTEKRQILPILQNLASDLFRLYDKNGDGVVDRKEYKRMVEDMASLSRENDNAERKPRADVQNTDHQEDAPHRKVASSIRGVFDRLRGREVDVKEDDTYPLSRRANETSGEAKMKRAGTYVQAAETEEQTEHVVASPELVESVQKSMGSIVFSDVKMDLRRLVFGAIPVLKRVLPGGPLILEPFTTTITGSFNRDEIMKSVLLDAALRKLVMRTLRKRVGFVRDFMEGSVFRGRSWKTFGGEGGPQVEVPRLTNVEFDENDKLIVTGSAKVRTHPDSPVIEQAFKLRTRLGTRRDGRFVRLEEPELALVLECPRSWDNALSLFCNTMGLQKPARPQPIYSFFPIYSPFKLQDDDGFDLGADNSIKSLYIKDGALRFEMSAILRPGRFLGSHYIAFSTPIRTVIVTLDRVAEGMRAARRVKKAQNSGVKRSRRFSVFGRIEDAIMNRQDRRLKSSKPKTKGFFSRFLDGYRNADAGEADKERVTQAIREFFGRQSR